MDFENAEFKEKLAVSEKEIHRLNLALSENDGRIAEKDAKILELKEAIKSARNSLMPPVINAFMARMTLEEVI